MPRQNLGYIAFGLICGLLAIGGLLLVTRPPRGIPVALLPPPEPAPIVVQISGAVAQPGVYNMPADSWVQDLIQAAGGLLPEADDSALNLAAALQDGIRLVIPSKRPTAASPTEAIKTPRQATTPNGPTPTPGADIPSPTGLININSATLEELDSLPGIGPAIAQRILDYRAANGLFAAIEDLQNVKGIGPTTFEKLKDLISVGP